MFPNLLDNFKDLELVIQRDAVTNKILHLLTRFFKLQIFQISGFKSMSNFFFPSIKMISDVGAFEIVLLWLSLQIFNQG